MRKIVKGPLAVAAGFILTALILFSCGRMPPPEIWQPNAADTAAIAAAVDANKELLRFHFNEAGFQYLEWVVPDSVVRKAISDNPFKQRYICDSMQQLFFTDSAGYKWSYKFIATADSALQETTATVSVVETIPGVLRLHAIKYTRFVKESIIVTPSETIRLMFHDTVFTDTSMVVEKPILGVVYNGCVFRKESGEWRLWKMAGGQRFYAPNPEDAPYFAAAYLTTGAKSDTYYLRPDTLHFGVQRFYDYPDGLLSYNLSDSLAVTGLLIYSTDLDKFNLVSFGGRRFRLLTANRIGFTQDGVQRLYIERIPFAVIYEAGGELNATIWGIPINVKGGGQ
ncbi:MAG: hypothetical protein ABIK47_05790 [candidate division WOR-3 bacterium]